MPALVAVAPHAFLNALGAHGRLRPLVRMTGPMRGTVLSTARKRAVTGTLTLRPVFDCVSVIHFPSWELHGRRRRSPCRWPVSAASKTAHCRGSDARVMKAAI